jgi:recombination associated protein RdgC
MAKGGAAAAADPRAQAFLGREFLTWLWFRCETDGGTFELPRGGRRRRKGERGKAGDDDGGEDEVGVVFDDYVALVSDGDEKEQNIVKNGSPHRSAEARTALLVGKVVASARLEVARGDRAWKATVSGETLDLRSVKYPDPEGSDPEERTLQRLDAMRELGDIVDELYGLFLSVRTSPAWEKEELPAVTRWIRKRAGAKGADQG